MRRPATLCIIRRGRKLFSVKRNSFIKGNISESKNKEIIFYNVLSLKINLLVEFNRKNITLTTNLIFIKVKLLQVLI